MWKLTYRRIGLQTGVVWSHIDSRLKSSKLDAAARLSSFMRACMHGDRDSYSAVGSSRGLERSSTNNDNKCPKCFGTRPMYTLRYTVCHPS